MRNFIIGLALGLVVVACGTTKYKYYVLKAREGKLNCKTEAEDLPISACDDTPQSKAVCFVVFRDEKMKMERDLVELRRRLQDAERRASKCK